jgi:DNA-binding beta-propeller fold protein YncE
MTKWLLIVAVMLIVPPQAHALKQLPGKAGCVAQASAPPAVKETCSVARLGRSSFPVLAVSPDHRNLYLEAGGTVSVFRIERGHLHQLRGKAGCVSGTGALGCARVPQLSSAVALTVSPDGRNVYVSIFNSPSVPGNVLTFARNAHTGALRLERCIGACTGARGVFDYVDELLVSHDGHTMYVASTAGHQGSAVRGGVAAFTRGSDGNLTRLAGCVSSDGFDGCTRAQGLGTTCCGMVLSPDSQSLYVTSSDAEPWHSASATFALSAFSLSAVDGGLTQLAGTAACINRDGNDGCAAASVLGNPPVNETGAPMISPNGHNLYLAHSSLITPFTSGPCGSDDNFVALFDRDPVSGALGPLRQDLPTCGSASLMSPDGRSLFAMGGEFGWTMSALARDRSTGLLAAAGCLGHRAPGCPALRHVNTPEAVAIDGNHYVYVASNDVDERETIGVFRR